MIAAIDAGNSSTKYYDGAVLKKFPSAISYGDGERNIKSTPGPMDFEWEYGGKRGFAGTLAEDESEYAVSVKQASKANFDVFLRVLLSLHQFGRGTDYQIIVGQPVETHTDEEKTSIKKLLSGKHWLSVNGEKKLISISQCEVAPEGVSAGLLAPGNGLVRVIDIGSSSVNYGTLIGRRFNNRGSFTLFEGMETKRHLSYEAFARQIGNLAESRGWKKSDAVYLCGGGAHGMIAPIREWFPDAQLLDLEFANVKAFYKIARRLYEGE